MMQSIADNIRKNYEEQRNQQKQIEMLTSLLTQHGIKGEKT